MDVHFQLTWLSHVTFQTPEVSQSNGSSIKSLPPLESGRQFWFHFEEGFQESRPNTLFLGELSIIHTFFGGYALVKISPILNIDWNYGWIAEEGNLYWMYTKDLILSSEEQQRAQRALLWNPTFSLLNAQTSDEE